MGARAAFLERVRARVARATGLAPAAASARPADAVSAARAVHAEARQEVERLLARFRTEAERVGVEVHRAPTPKEAGDVVARLAAARGVRRVVTWGRRALGGAHAVADRLRAAGLDVAEGSPDAVAENARETLRERVAMAELGLTTADLAVAETGTLVLASGPGRGRGVSLLPTCHVAVFGPDQLIPGLAQAGVVLEAWHAAPPAGLGANLVFITGPSRTADIELTLTRGVHGPKEVHAVFVDEL